MAAGLLRLAELVLLRRQAALVGAPEGLRSGRAVLQRGLLGLRRCLEVLQRGRVDLPCAGGVLLGYLAALRGAREVLSGAHLVLQGALRVLLRGAVGLHRARRELRGALQRLLRAGGVLLARPLRLRRTGRELFGAGQLLRGAHEQRGACAGRVVVEVRGITRRLNRRERAVPKWPRGQAGRVGQCTVLLADQGRAVDLHRTSAGRFGVGIPVAVGGHDREVLLARVLHRVLAHAGVDAVGHAGVVATDTRETLAGWRRAARRLREQLVEPGGALGRIEVVDRQELARVDGRTRWCVFRVDRQKADTEAVGQWRECQTRGALGQADAGAVVRVPDREVRALVAGTGARVRTDDHAKPGAAAGSAF